MKLDSATVLLAAVVAGFVWWKQRPGGGGLNLSAGTPGATTGTDAGAKAPTPDAAIGVQLAGGVFDRKAAFMLAVRDLDTRVGGLKGYQQERQIAGSVERFRFFHVWRRSGVFDGSTEYIYSWQPADGAVRRLS